MCIEACQFTCAHATCKHTHTNRKFETKKRKKAGASEKSKNEKKLRAKWFCPSEINNLFSSLPLLCMRRTQPQAQFASHFRRSSYFTFYLTSSIISHSVSPVAFFNAFVRLYCATANRQWLIQLITNGICKFFTV